MAKGHSAADLPSDAEGSETLSSKLQIPPAHESHPGHAESKASKIPCNQLEVSPGDERAAQPGHGSLLAAALDLAQTAIAPAAPALQVGKAHVFCPSTYQNCLQR